MPFERARLPLGASRLERAVRALVPLPNRGIIPPHAPRHAAGEEPLKCCGRRAWVACLAMDLFEVIDVE